VDYLIGLCMVRDAEIDAREAVARAEETRERG
jgi:hypothetical protein